jgi:hypothetical protein
MKDSVYRARCLERILNQCSGLDVMLGLADVAFDIFLIGLKEKNKNVTKEEIRRAIEEISEWRKTISRS